MDLGFMAGVFVRLLPPLGLTIVLSLTALAIATPLGLTLGACRAAFPGRGPLAALAGAWVFAVRGTPFLIQVFAIYFLLPELGLRLPLFWLGVLALVVNSVGYQIEIGRAAVLSVPSGQWEAAAALGFGRTETLARFVLPQAARRMAGPVMNELSQLVKASSVLSIITLYELHKAAEAIISANLRFTEVLIVEAALYFAFIYALSLTAGRLERSLSAAGGLAASR